MPGGFHRCPQGTHLNERQGLLLDNVYVERLWCSLRQEEVCRHENKTVIKPRTAWTTTCDTSTKSVLPKDLTLNP